MLVGTRQFPQPIRDYLSAYFSHDATHLLRVDIVLALLRGGYREEAENLAGVPIQYGKPALRANAVYHRDRQPRVTYVNPPTSPRSGVDLVQRLRRTKVGMTIPQLLARGWTADTIKHARRSGHLVIS